MNFKKMIGVTLATVLCLASSVTAFAAGLSAEEQVILDKLKAGIEVDGTVINVPVELINQVENELMKNDTDITADQAVVVLQQMDEAIAVVQAEGITTVEELKGSMDQILPLVEVAADAVGYTVAYDATSSGLSATDADGNTVFTTAGVIKQTGFDLTAPVVVGGIAVTLLAAGLVVANKKKLFVKSI